MIEVCERWLLKFEHNECSGINCRPITGDSDIANHCYIREHASMASVRKLAGLNVLEALAFVCQS